MKNIPTINEPAATTKLKVVELLNTMAITAGPIICPKLYHVVREAAATGLPALRPASIVSIVTPMKVAPNKDADTNKRPGPELKTATIAPVTCRK
ncbi:hypothetical protein GCM10009585_10230 [Brevibacterium paucivorans]